jgi:hypothetical protein
VGTLSGDGGTRRGPDDPAVAQASQGRPCGLLHAGNWAKLRLRTDGYVGARTEGEGDERAACQVLAARSRSTTAKSGHTNVLSFLTLAAGRDVELDALALVERLVAAALDVGEVDEHVVAMLSRNEAEALLGVEELYGTRSQRILSSVLSLSV